MDFQIIDRASDLEALCRRTATAPFVGLDTEFVSEHTYRPELCLIQLALEDDGRRELLVVDPLALPSVQPLWRALAERSAVTVIHGGREEILFAMRAVPEPKLESWVDLQLLAAFCGHGYPIGHGPLVEKELGRSVASGEARTDWRRRPLSRHQLEYAVDDVRHLSALYRRLMGRLETAGRGPWLPQEMAAWIAEVTAGETASRWRKVKGAGRLPHRCLGLLKELWRWRDEKAAELNRPPRRVLRDDLLLELARRGSADPLRIRSVRGMERGDYRKFLPELAEHLAAALARLRSEWPQAFRQERESGRIKVLTKVLALGLEAVCEEAGVAASLVATANDLRRLIRHRVDGEGGAVPRLARGWRADLVGEMLEQVLEGRVSLRIRDAQAEQPLVFEPVESSKNVD